MHNPDMILGPVITEKSMAGSQKGIYTFKVAKNATKSEIKSEIENHFGVKVKDVRTLNTKAKDRRVGKYTGKTKTYKKAIVTLCEGSTIEL